MTDTPKPLTADEIADLRARAKAATPGEWEAVTRDDPRGQPVPYYQSLICTVEHSPDKHLSIVAKNGHRISREEWEANNDYIAAANPETILRLINMVERQQSGDHKREIENAALYLPTYKINDLQLASIRRLVETLKWSHYADITVRRDGQDHHFEADWLKHLIQPPAQKEDGE